MARRKPAKRAKPVDSAADFERALESRDDRQYLLTLYITGATPKSLRAIRSVKEICEKHLHGHYKLEVVDIYQQPEKAKSQDIVAAPTLIKQLPQPLRKLIGDMANTDRILMGLDLRPAK
jgi:circadian clock protein KaiB